MHRDNERAMNDASRGGGSLEAGLAAEIERPQGHRGDERAMNDASRGEGSREAALAAENERLRAQLAELLRGRAAEVHARDQARGLLQAVAEHAKRFQGLDVDWQAEVLVTSGATEALGDCLFGLIEPGDEVVLIEPLYDSYLPMVRRAGGIPKMVRLEPPSWRLPKDELAAAFSDRTKLILFNTPMNPCSKVFDEEELDFIASLCLTAAVSFDEFAVAWFVSGLNKTVPVVILEILTGNIDPQVNAIGTAVFATEVTAFHLSQRGFRWALHGEAFYDERFWEEYGETALMFGVLRGTGAAYRRFISPRLPAPRGFAAPPGWSMQPVPLPTLRELSGKAAHAPRTNDWRAGLRQVAGLPDPIGRIRTSPVDFTIVSVPARLDATDSYSASVRFITEACGKSGKNRRDETILREPRNHPETEGEYFFLSLRRQSPPGGLR